MLWYGQEVPQDSERAKKLLRRAREGLMIQAERGQLEANLTIASIYTNGEGTDKDWDAAREWLGKGIDPNDPDCKVTIRNWLDTVKGDSRAEAEKLVADLVSTRLPE